MLLLTIVATCLSSGGFADTSGASRSSHRNWYACEASTDCTWLIGEGGWPTAVRADSAQAYRRWVESQAPFTTYFMPGDCFSRGGEFEDYVLRSKSGVACADRSCKLTTEPECTK